MNVVCDEYRVVFQVGLISCLSMCTTSEYYCLVYVSFTIRVRGLNYFRCCCRKHIEVTFSALEGALIELGYPIQKGTALSALKSFSSKL